MSAEEPLKKSHKKKIETKNVDKKVYQKKVKSKKGKKELNEEVYVTETKEVKEPVTKTEKKKNSHKSNKQYKKNVEKAKIENTQKFDENSKNELKKNSEIDGNTEVNEETIFSEVHKEESKKSKKPKKYVATDRTKRSLEETESKNLSDNQAVLDIVEENVSEQEWETVKVTEIKLCKRKQGNEDDYYCNKKWTYVVRWILKLIAEV